MTTYTKALRIVGIIGVALGLVGCGTSGSRPVLFSEIQFLVQKKPCQQDQPCPARAQTEFTAELEVGGILHTFPQSFLATSDFHFFAENAAPPYGGRFTIVGDNSYDIEVTLIVTGLPTRQTGDSGGVAVPAIVGSFLGTLSPPAQEVRFDVCIPSLTPGTCFGAGDSGAFGPTFNGTIGDSAQTHLLGAAVPSIYFLENAVDSVNGVFTLTPFTGQDLLVQLFLNDALKQSQSGSHDVIIRQDL